MLLVITTKFGRKLLEGIFDVVIPKFGISSTKKIDLYPGYPQAPIEQLMPQSP
jgi:hypothetical protein